MNLPWKFVPDPVNPGNPYWIGGEILQGEVLIARVSLPVNFGSTVEAAEKRGFVLAAVDALKTSLEGQVAQAASIIEALEALPEGLSGPAMKGCKIAESMRTQAQAALALCESPK